MLKVLIVDDDDLVLLVQNKFLQRCGFSSEILTFKGGQRALEYLETNLDGSACLILLDINMPGMNGWQFLDNLKNVDVPQDMHVIMVSSSIKNIDKEVKENYEWIVGIIEKPVSIRNCEEIRKIPQLYKYF